MEGSFSPPFRFCVYRDSRSDSGDTKKASTCAEASECWTTRQIHQNPFCPDGYRRTRLAQLFFRCRRRAAHRSLDEQRGIFRGDLEPNLLHRCFNVFQRLRHSGFLKNLVLLYPLGVPPRLLCAHLHSPSRNPTAAKKYSACVPTPTDYR